RNCFHVCPLDARSRYLLLVASMRKSTPGPLPLDGGGADQITTLSAASAVRYMGVYFACALTQGLRARPPSPVRAGVAPAGGVPLPATCPWRQPVAWCSHPGATRQRRRRRTSGKR